MLFIRTNRMKGESAMKKTLMIMIISCFIVLFSIVAYAGTWKQDAKGWWWDNGNETYPANCWQWCDGNNDGISECYYFGSDGYCLRNTTTPDGYQVNGDGAWVVNGKVQTQGSSNNTQVQNNVIQNPLCKTNYPTDLGITIGTPLSTALSIFNTYGINYMTDGRFYNYFDQYGWIRTFGFNGRGKCDTIVIGVGNQPKETSEYLINEFSKNIHYPLIKHFKTANSVMYQYQNYSLDSETESIYQEIQNGTYYTSYSYSQVVDGITW